MFLVVRGKVVVWQQKNDGTSTKICVLGEGDTFGDAHCVLGRPRDSRCQCESDCFLVEWMRRDMLVVMEQSSSRVEKMMESTAKWVGAPIMRTDSVTFSPSAASGSVKGVVLDALRSFRSTISLCLEDHEIENLAGSVRLLTCPPDCGMPAPIATLFRQGDSDETGWGVFGRSAFVLLEGEVLLTCVLEGQDEQPKEVPSLFREVFRPLFFAERPRSRGAPPKPASRTAGYEAGQPHCRL